MAEHRNTPAETCSGALRGFSRPFGDGGASARAGTCATWMMAQTMRGARPACILAAALWLGGCAVPKAGTSEPAPAARLPVAKRHVGYVTVASWYGPCFRGHRTASGDVFNENAMTAASRTLPLGTRVRVVNLRNGRSVMVRINDRGPYVRGRGIDLSKRAAERLGIVRRGIARVRVEWPDETASSRDVRPSRRIYRETPSRDPHRRYRRRRARRRHYYASVLERPRPSPRTVSSPVGEWLLGMLP